jgi:glycine cleavage system H lipoate-binding protein
MVIIIFLAFILICVAIDAIVQFSKKRRAKVVEERTVSTRIFSLSSLFIPRGFYFDKSHTWAFMEKNGVIKIGIDDFLLRIVSPLSGIKMKSAGEKIIKGEPALSIMQNGKQLTIKSPVSGTIIFQNKEVAYKSESKNLSISEEGWIYAIEPSNWEYESTLLFMADKYAHWLKNEFMRLKDFLSHTLQRGNIDLSPAIIQDGGELYDNVLENFGPEIWEEFQMKFIDSPA